MSYIPRIISMRDADERRTKPAISRKTYVLARPTICDDTDSDYADDEYETDDEFIISSSDSEQCECEQDKHDMNSSVSDDSASDLHIIDDYVDALVSPSCQEFHDLDLEDKESGEDGPPAIRLNLASQVGSAETEDIGIAAAQDIEKAEGNDTLVLEESISLREDAFLLRLEDIVINDDEADGWILASACFDDSWVFEIEAAEEDRIARQEDELVVAKIRRSPREDTRAPSQSSPLPTRSNRNEDRKVVFALRPDVLGE